MRPFLRIVLITLVAFATIPVSATDSKIEAEALIKIATETQKQGDFSKSLEYFQNALSMWRAIGNRDGEAETLNNIGDVYFDGLGEKRKALGYYQEALPISRETNNKSCEVTTLNNIGITYHILGENAKALDSFNKALTIANGLSEKKYKGKTLANLGHYYNEMGENAEALKYYEQALPLIRAGGDKGSLAGTLDNIGLVYFSLSDNAKALSYFEQALQIYRIVRDRNGEAVILNNMGLLYDGIGEKRRALEYYQQALPLMQNGGNRATTLNNIGLLFFGQGENMKALDFYEQALNIHRETGNNVGEAITLNNFGLVYASMGEKAKALGFYEQALPFFSAVGNKSGEATMLSNIGSLYDGLGDKAKALDYYNRALFMYRTVGDKRGEAITLNNIGNFYSDLGEYTKALGFYEEALPIHRAIGNKIGEAMTLTNTGRLYSNLGENSKAMSYYQQALPIHRAIGDKSGEQLTLTNLGSLYFDLGENEKTLEYYELALSTSHAVGDPNREVKLLEDMAVIMPVLNRPKESTAIFQKIADIQGQLREWAFPALSEAQKVTYARTFDAIQFAFLSHTVTFQKNDPVSLSVCFDAWLANKGSVLQAQGRLQDAILASKDPQVRTLSKTLQETRLQLAHLFQKRPEGLTPENYEQELKELQDRKESLEAGLAKLNQAFAVSRDARRINGAKLATLLPKDSAYLDFARINWYDFEHSHFTEARYLVFVFQPGKAKDLELIDLGTAEPIDKAVQSFQSRVQGGMPLDGNLDPLYQLLIKPLDGFLTERKQLLISPDGPLNLVPFEVLKSQDGTSLMDRFTISYLNSGQDVARFSVPHTASHKVVVLANPDFDLGGEAKSIPGPDMGLYKGKRSIDIGNIHFNPLPGTQKEAKAISSQFQRKDVLSLFGSGALESGLMSVKAPHILHLATHGYFLGHQDTSIEDKLLGSAGRGVKLVGNGGALSAEPRIDSKLENPMLRSGIALARANTSIQKGDDEGLVCAEKILGMDLFGTDLVVLSACNTGVGKVQDGEGVFGLKRAFILAGARTLVVSLWPVPDEETKDLMVQFYKGLVKGKTKAQALAQAKKLIANKKPDPYYWAAFVLVGNPD